MAQVWVYASQGRAGGSKIELNVSPAFSEESKPWIALAWSMFTIWPFSGYVSKGRRNILFSSLCLLMNVVCGDVKCKCNFSTIREKQKPRGLHMSFNTCPFPGSGITSEIPTQLLFHGWGGRRALSSCELCWNSCFPVAKSFNWISVMCMLWIPLANKDTGLTWEGRKEIGEENQIEFWEKRRRSQE